MRIRPGFRYAKVPALAAATLLVLASAASSQSDDEASGEPGTAERCRGLEHREFDFWVGTWDVRSAEGELLGTNEIRRVAGGCGLLENWRGAGGGEGMSINAYDRERQRWTQRWVGVGATLWLEGGLEERQMVLAGKRSTPRGEVLDRITWTPLPGGRLRQVWDVSADAGESWQPIFEGFYSPSGERSSPAAFAADQ